MKKITFGLFLICLLGFFQLAILKEAQNTVCAIRIIEGATGSHDTSRNPAKI